MSAGGLVRLALALTALTVTGCTLNRPQDPVVLTGAQVPALASVSAGDVVAFRWFNGWDQVPVQVDERKPVDLGAVYNSTPMGFVTTVYADPGTFTGADANAMSGFGHGTVKALAAVAPVARRCGTGRTAPWFARLDFLFTDVSDSAVSRCQTLDDRYGSDHRPIVLTIDYPPG